MKNNLPLPICESANLVNRTVRDVWIEAYLAVLERWQIQAAAQGIILAQLRDAWSAYGQYRASAEPSFRWLAWSAIQTAAATLAHLRPKALSSDWPERSTP
jgi:hypothetical protein